MAPDSAAQAVLSFYSLQPGLVRRLEALGSAGGWSGSRLWRVEVAAETGPRDLAGVPEARTRTDLLCLRRHPESWQDTSRLRFIHGVLKRVYEGGLTVVPVPLHTTSGESVVERAGFLWELTPWMPGTADFHDHPTCERLQAAFQILARFHLLAMTKGVPRVTHNLAPALITRSSVLRKIAQHADQIESHLLPGLGEELDVRAIDLLRLIRTRGPAIAPNVAAAAEKNWFQQPVIRDIWHDHLLFTGNELTGIVDFGAMNVDTPLTDVARLVGSLVRDDREARRVALDAYSKVRPLTCEDRELIDLLDRSGVIVAAVNWLKWLYIDRRDMGHTPPIIRRLDEILQRLKNQP